MSIIVFLQLFLYSKYTNNWICLFVATDDGTLFYEYNITVLKMMETENDQFLYLASVFHFLEPFGTGLPLIDSAPSDTKSLHFTSNSKLPY